MDSTSTSNRDTNSETSSYADGRGSIKSIDNRAKYPNHFRGTGQNGQILKEDMKCWSRRLHFLEPEDLFKINKRPSRTLIIGFCLAVTGFFVIVHSIKSSINKIVSEKII